MTGFSVWAPRAKEVELVLADRRVPMTGRSDGWFETRTDAEPGTLYGFSLDGGPVRPDPRSRYQPEGVHGRSCVVDDAGFRWTDDSWAPEPLADWILYELHVGTFSPEGTFAGAKARLDHLVDLGVNAVQVMPVAEFPGSRGWGYDCVDLYSVRRAYGGPDEFRQFVDACHARGLAVALDVVYNHLGPSGNYLREFGPYFTDVYSTPWGEAVNLDGPGSDEVRGFLIDNGCMWLRDYHCDALRIDAVQAFLDRSAVHFLEELEDRVTALAEELGRDLYVIAESDLNDPRVIEDRERGGYGLDAQWSDDFHHSIHAAMTGERLGYYMDFGPVEHIATTLERGFVYEGRYSPHRKRRHGRSAEGLAGSRFLGYLQNHDQVGNRPMGERTSALLSTGLLKVGAALVLTAPFVPLLFQGEEWAAATPFLYFTDHDDPDLAKAVTEGRRLALGTFGWDVEDIADPQDPGTFERSVQRWDEVHERPHAEMLDWHKKLIALRHSLPVLRDGRMGAVATRYSESERWLVMERGPITIACNLSPGEVDPEVEPQRRRHLLLASGAEPRGSRLPPESVALWSEESSS